MIINHRYKFIFLKTRKTGGTSLEIALSKYCGPTDVVGFIVDEDENKRKQLGYQCATNNKKPLQKWSAKDIYLFSRDRTIPQSYPEHATASEVKEQVTDKIWNEYFKFTILRDPRDMIVSRYWWDRHIKDETRDFKNWLLDNPGRIRDNTRIFEISGKSAMDDIVRYDNLETDLERISQKIGLPENAFDLMKSIRTKTGIRDKRASAESYFENFPDGQELIRILGQRDRDAMHAVQT